MYKMSTVLNAMIELNTKSITEGKGFSPHWDIFLSEMSESDCLSAWSNTLIEDGVAEKWMKIARK